MRRPNATPRAGSNRGWPLSLRKFGRSPDSPDKGAGAGPDPPVHISWVCLSALAWPGATLPKRGIGQEPPPTLRLQVRRLGVLGGRGRLGRFAWLPTASATEWQFAGAHPPASHGRKRWEPCQYYESILQHLRRPWCWSGRLSPLPVCQSRVLNDFARFLVSHFSLTFARLCIPVAVAHCQFPPPRRFTPCLTLLF